MQSQISDRNVIFNRQSLDAQTLDYIDWLNRMPIPNGRFWYDAVCGAWGIENGPCVGFVLAGLPLPDPMPPDISGGGTGIFVNGRELHPADRAALINRYGQAWPGRYLLNAVGLLSTEFGMPIINLAAAAPAQVNPNSGMIAGMGGFGAAVDGGVVFNMPDGGSYVV